MGRAPGFIREDVRDAEILLNCLKMKVKAENRELVYDLITCPVDTKSEELIHYWAACAKAILTKSRIPLPWFETSTLQGCELQYKAYDIHHQLLRRIGRPDDCTTERKAICEKIAALMAESKAPYIRRCRSCGRELKIGTVYNYCEDCFRGLQV